MNAAMPRRLKLFQNVVVLLLLVAVAWMCSGYYDCLLRTSSPCPSSLAWPSHLIPAPAARRPTPHPPTPHPPNQCFQVISPSGPHSRREKVPLVSVNGTHTLLISAYLDLRGSRREVRIISVALRIEQAAYRCILCCQGQPHISPGSAHVHDDHFGFEYGTADIFCPLPDGCSDPSHVAVSAVAPPEEESEKEKPLRFLEVQNRRPINKDFPHNFSVCLSTMFDFSNVLQLIQSMEMLRLMGVTKVVVYKTSCNADTQRVLEYYEHIGFMEVIVWPLSRVLDVSRGWLHSLSQGQLHYYGQIPALCDCLYRNMYLSRYLGLHDMDELIVPQTVDSWTELLPLLERHHGMDFGYMFENFVLPNSGPGAPPTPTTKARSPRHWREVEGVNILDHLHYEPLNTAEFSKFKILVNPRAVFIPSVHGFLDSLRGTVRVPSHVARMYHTREPLTAGLKPKDLTYDGRLLAYRDRLVPAVDVVLEQTGLLHQDLTQLKVGS